MATNELINFAARIQRGEIHANIRVDRSILDNEETRLVFWDITFQVGKVEIDGLKNREREERNYKKYSGSSM